MAIKIESTTIDLAPSNTILTPRDTRLAPASKNENPQFLGFSGSFKISGKRRKIEREISRERAPWVREIRKGGFRGGAAG